MNLELSSVWEQILPIISKVIGWSAIFLAPVHSIMLAITFLVGMDLITGLLAAHKRGEKLSSNGIRRTITKTLAYMSAIIASHVMSIYFLDGIIDPVKIVSGLIAVTEFQSLMENLSSITGVDLWKQLLEKLQGKKIIPEPKEKIEELPQIEEPKKAKKSKKKSHPKRIK